nr:MAG TPA: leucine rich repeat protein [Caudoviricetes sp.]
MAYDKVVDSAQLDGAMTSTANAIRAKNGGSGSIQWDAATGFADAVAAISSGGTVRESDINFWDYDGTLLYAWTLAELAGKTELPPLPSHDGLICQGWNWTFQDIKDAGRELDIGALYITDDGKTRLYVDTETWDDFVLNYWQSTRNATTVDWGDGTTPESKAQDSFVEHRHTYATSGSYVITMSVREGTTMRLGNGSNGRMLIANGGTDIGRCSMLTKANIGERVERITDQSFYGCVRLQSVSVPSGVLCETWRTFENATQLRTITATFFTSLYQSFYCCSNLRAIASAKGTTMSPNSSYLLSYTAVRQANFDILSGFQAKSLERAHIKAVDGVVGVFAPCSLLEATIPEDATTFKTTAFQDDFSLRKVECLGNIASIPAQTFQRCYALRYVDFTHCTAVPTLANVNAFASTHSQLEIRVPAALAEEWKAATNWSSLADQIVGVSAE